MTTQVKTPAEIAAMREGGSMLATVLVEIEKRVKAGMTTADLSSVAKRKLKELNAKPAFLGYQGFSDILCVSINDEVVHGIPSKRRIIREGDIVSCDFGVLHKGLVTDAAITIIVGAPRSQREVDLVSVTKKSLMSGIAEISDGVHIGDVGFAIQRDLDKAKLGIVKDFVGHGVGHNVHEEPGIPNYGVRNKGFVLRAGMTVAIEPMATLGGPEVYIDSDGWTAKTTDESRAAHFEHTVLVTKSGYEILTLP